MARGLTNEEEVSRARLRLQLMAEKADLELELARRRARVQPAAAAGPLLATVAPAVLAALAGLLMSRRSGWRERTLAVVARLLSR